MRYIGGKSLLLDNINNIIDRNVPNSQSIFDIFAGTGVVSQNFKSKGYKVYCNDFLYFSYVLQQCYIGLNQKPTFRKLKIDNPIDFLNNITMQKTSFSTEQCFIYNNYSPINNCKRMYFQPENALKIDLIRLTIQHWFIEKKINSAEYYYLLSSLLEAIPYVANITGVYAAYLKFWDKRTYNQLLLKDINIVNNNKSNKCFNYDYKNVLGLKCDILYVDPPYNSREYVPNYHILETIAKYDYPQIHGITGLRNYDNQKSAFCKKDKVAAAFDCLIGNSKCKYILISYNNEGLISTNDLSKICKKYATNSSFKLYEFDYRRYKNKIPNNKKGLKEQLYFLERW